MTQYFHQGIVAPLDVNNVDTDQIIPKQFLTSVSREGFGESLFFDWRYLEDGSDNPEFILNHPSTQGASVLLARENFGCGSSREHAPWAIKQFGFNVILAPSYADIFFNNCVNNQILPILLANEQIDALFDLCAQPSNSGQHQISVDLKNQCLIFDDSVQFTFDINPDVKQRLLDGLDFVGVTEQYIPQISEFETKQSESQPWL